MLQLCSSVAALAGSGERGGRGGEGGGSGVSGNGRGTAVGKTTNLEREGWQ